MAKAKIVKVADKIAETVADGYKKIEDGTVSGYKRIEQGAVSGFTKLADGFVDQSDKRGRISGGRQKADCTGTGGP